MQTQGFIRIIFLLGVIAILLTLAILFLPTKHLANSQASTAVLEKPNPSPFLANLEKVPYDRSYITVLVGDSMIEALGKNANSLREALIEKYPTHEFVNYNYGFGATNILTLPERLTKQTTYQGENFPPIIEQNFDLIIFESFAYNPLSQFPLEEGLSKQTEILESSIKQISLKHPQAVIAIMVPIAPSEENFAKGVYDLSPEVRQQWVKERMAYIRNAIEFANANNLPLINVYEKSLNSTGEVDLKYIDSADYIHPSKEGLLLTSQTIADFIYQHHIFPE